LISIQQKKKKEREGRGDGKEWDESNYVAEMPAKLACPPYFTSI